MMQPIRLTIHHLYKRIQDSLQGEEVRLFCWAPVFLGLGIATFSYVKTFFWWPTLYLISGFLTISGFYLRGRWGLRPIITGLGLFLLGYGLYGHKTERLKTPMIQEEQGPVVITGELLELEARPGDWRFTIRVTNNSLGIPLAKVRLSHRIKKGFDPSKWSPHMHLRIKGMLLPPRRAVFPGGFDFQRKAYYDGVSAIGYTLSLPESIDMPANQSFLTTTSQQIDRWRHELTLFLRAQLPGDYGAIAAALITGDRAGIRESIRDDFANAGIAHILAISGLHLSIVAGLIFFVIRGLMLLCPPLVLRVDIKKIAAVFAILGTFSYMLISGSSTPAQRSFMMTALIMIGILIDRTTITLRNVALAALVILLIFPESLMTPSFQLSFAAVIALVAGFEWVRPYLAAWHAQEKGWILRLCAYFAGLLLSSFFATIATTPFTIYTFHRFSLVALISNLLAIPLVTFLLMPILVAFILFQKIFMGFGWESLLAVPLSLSLDGLITIAEISAAWPLAKIHVPLMPPYLLGIMTVSLLWLALCRTNLRHMAWVPMGLSVFMLLRIERPDVFISEKGHLIAAIDDQGTGYISTKQKERFAQKVWKEALGIGVIKKMSGPIEIHGRPYRFEQHQDGIVIVDGDRAVGQIPLGDLEKRGGHFLWLQETSPRVMTVW